MKKIFLIVIISSAFIACNPNPSKEARIQSLETSIQQAMDQINTLEIKIQALEDANQQLKSRILELEK